MNRRNFLKRAVLAAGASMAVGPAILASRSVPQLQYKTSIIGIKAQLDAVQVLSITDLPPHPHGKLNLPAMFEELYKIKRARGDGPIELWLVPESAHELMT